MTLTPGTRLGPYEVLAPLGAGGMGEVYRCRDPRLGREVAIKVLPSDRAADPQRLARFQSEARAVSALNHPNIVTVHEVGTAGTGPYLVMELVDGESLRAALDAGPLAIRRVAGIGAQVAAGLAKAHAAGVVHRDLKPENVMVTRDGFAKVLDFGIARLLWPDEDHGASADTATFVKNTETGVILGTLGYLSPEQAAGKPADDRSDQFALGALLYEMATGVRPFKRATALESLAATAQAEAEPVRSKRPDLPLPLAWIIDRCLSKSPEDRYASTRDLARDLADVRDRWSEIPAAGATGAGTPARGGAARLAALIAAGAVPAVLLFLAGRASTGPAPAAREWQAQRLGGAPISLQPVISPDGQTLAFQAMVNGTTQIGVMKLDGAWRVLTNDTTHGPIIDLCWSSDGTRIYFDRVLDAPVGIFSVSVFGEDARPVLENASTPRALPDGSMLVVRINADRNRQLYRFWPGSSPPRLEPLGALLNNDLVGPAAQPFPDGREAAFHGRPADRAAEPDAVHAIDLATGRTRRLAPSLTVPESNWMFPLATTADRALVVIQAGDLHRIVALPRDGSDRFETVTTVSQRPLYVQAAADGSLFTDQVIQSHELRRYSVPGYRLEDRLTLGTDSDAASLEPAPLADGRVLFASRQAGRLRVMVVSPGRAPASFVQSAEESSAPVALVGTDRVALLLGRPPNRKVAIVSAADGRVIRVLGGVDGNLVTRMAGSPDGRQLYFAAGGRVSSISTDDGSPRVIHAGAGVAVDPLGRYIVIQIRDAGETQLLKWPLPDGPGEPIRPSGGFRFAPASIAGHAVARDGRIAVKIASNGSWYWALGILDARTGAIDKLAPDEHLDMFGGFTANGSILLVSDPTLAGLWRFRPVER